MHLSYSYSWIVFRFHTGIMYDISNLASAFCAAQPDDEVVYTQFGMDFMNRPFKLI